MTGFRRTCFLLAIAAAVGVGTSARAEGIFPVNNPGAGNWVFDQPSVAANGTVLHLAFVGDNTAGAEDPSLDTRLYYGAVNGGADFTSKATVRSHVVVTEPVAIDNGAAYSNARHPQIALRSATELAILFQAVPGGGTDHKLFLARVTIDNNAVKAQKVEEVKSPASGSIAGNLVDPSFALVASDNSLRVAYTDDSSGYGNVYYARVGLDNAFLAGSPLLLSSQPNSQGVQPLPRLRLDGNGSSHVVWAANNFTGTATGIYYAMVHAASPGAADNLAIGATQVLTGGYRWGFPSLFLTSSSNVWILASDEPPAGSGGVDPTGLAGSVGISEVNPYAVTFDGNPVNVNNVGSNASFFYNPPGGSVLSSDFDAYRPVAELDSLSRVHVAGYGFRGGPPLYQGTPGRYYVMSLGSTATSSGTSSLFASMVASPVSVGIGDVSFAMQLPGDYTRPAFTHFSGKSVNFWSGPDDAVTDPTATRRNLYVTSTFSPTDPTKQSGCSMVDDPRRGEEGRMPGAAVLLLPAALLALRRAARKAFAR